LNEDQVCRILDHPTINSRFRY